MFSPFRRLKSTCVSNFWNFCTLLGTVNSVFSKDLYHFGTVLESITGNVTFRYLCTVSLIYNNVFVSSNNYHFPIYRSDYQFIFWFKKDDTIVVTCIMFNTVLVFLKHITICYNVPTESRNNNKVSIEICSKKINVFPIKVILCFV